MVVSESTKFRISLISNIVLLFIIGMLSLSKTEPVIIKDDAQSKKKIELLENINKQLNIELDDLYTKVDSLETKKEIIKHEYKKQITRINTANTEQLDSIIRANW